MFCHFFITSFVSWESLPTGCLGALPPTSIAASKINLVTVSFIPSMLSLSSFSKAAYLFASTSLNWSAFTLTASRLACYFMTNFILSLVKWREILDLTNLWSLHFTLPNTSTSCTMLGSAECMKSISFLVFPLWLLQVYFLLLCFLKKVFIIRSLFLSANSTNISHLAFLESIP